MRRTGTTLSWAARKTLTEHGSGCVEAFWCQGTVGKARFQLTNMNSKRNFAGIGTNADRIVHFPRNLCWIRAALSAGNGHST